MHRAALISVFLVSGVARAMPIHVDARALSIARAVVPSVGETPIGQVMDLDLSPGDHAFGDPLGAHIDFTVTPAGLVESPGCALHTVTGCGTPALVVLGADVEIDGSALLLPRVVLREADSQRATSVPSLTARHVRLLPGPYTLSGVELTIDDDGTVLYDQAVEGCLEGAFTDTLFVRGFPVDLDATALATPVLTLKDLATAAQVRKSSAQPLRGRLLPGRYGIATAAEAGLTVTLDDTGVFDFPAATDGIVKGRGDSSLVVLGYPVRVDATEAGAPAFRIIEPGGQHVWRPTDVAADLRLLPGRYHYQDDTKTDVAFLVDDRGLVRVAPSFDVRGDFTRALTVGQRDLDHDRIDDRDDTCPDTLLGNPVDAHGCSGRQHVATACPADAFHSPAARVACVDRAASAAQAAGLLDDEERAGLVREALR